MRKKGHYNIGVLIGGVHTYFPQQIIHGIREAAEEIDANVFFFLGTHTRVFFKNLLEEDFGNAFDYQFNTIYDYSLLSGLDGLIINYGTLGHYLENDDLDLFIERFHHIPIVVLTGLTDADNCHYLLSDNYNGFRRIMEHLIVDHGYRKILHVTGPENNRESIERRQAYLDALAEHDIPFTEDMIAAGNFTEFVESQVESLLDAHPDAEAIAFSNDEMALCGYRICQRRGMVIGRDIAITGYDDSNFSSTMDPPLTTVSQDGRMLGRQSVIDLLNIFHGGRPASRRVSFNLITRESCGCVSQVQKEEDTYASLYMERKELKSQLSRTNADTLLFQRKSWLISTFSQTLSAHIPDEHAFCYHAMETFHKIMAANVYLFLLDAPIVYRPDSEWTVPNKMYYAASCDNGKIVSYYPYDRPVVDKDHPIHSYFSPDSARQYNVLLLFSGDRQYGVLVCDSCQEDFPFLYILSLQLGLSLRYLESGKLEAAHLREVSHTLEMMEEKNRVLDYISGYDALTGLLNLRGFMKYAEQMCSNHISRQLYLVYADLDHLKEINDSWGHPEGDYALLSIGKILKQCLRDSDLLARIGGDEYVALINSDTENFEELFRTRVDTAFKNLNDTSDKPYYIEVSIGMCRFTCKEETDLKLIMKEADISLYSDKQNRRDSARK